MSSCCSYNSSDYTVCQSNYDDCGLIPLGCNEECVDCPTRGSTAESSPTEFQEFIAWFLDDSPGESCATAGKAAYRWRFTLKSH